MCLAFGGQATEVVPVCPSRANSGGFPKHLRVQRVDQVQFVSSAVSLVCEIEIMTLGWLKVILLGDPREKGRKPNQHLRLML